MMIDSLSFANLMATNCVVLRSKLPAEVFGSYEFPVIYCNHYRIAGVCHVPGAHGKVQITHGKGFAVCCSRQRTHDKLFHGEPYFYPRPNFGHTVKLCRRETA